LNPSRRSAAASPTARADVITALELFERRCRLPRKSQSGATGSPVVSAPRSQATQNFRGCSALVHELTEKLHAVMPSGRRRPGVECGDRHPKRRTS